MPGPCSLPNGPKSEWEELNQLRCNNHKYCWPDLPSSSKGEHDWITNREWLKLRNKLKTGKTSSVV